MLDWGGIDRQMEMRETSRAQDKKPADNNARKKTKGLWTKRFLK